MAGRHLSIAIARSAGEVYDFACRPQNLSLWASGLGQLSHVGDQWIARGPQGDTRLRFTERNAYGVLDHWVTLPDGMEVYIPLRVVANGAASCEVVLTLFRQPGMSDAKFAADADWVMRDLGALRQLMEAT